MEINKNDPLIEYNYSIATFDMLCKALEEVFEETKEISSWVSNNLELGPKIYKIKSYHPDLEDKVQRSMSLFKFLIKILDDRLPEIKIKKIKESDIINIKNIASQSWELSLETCKVRNRSIDSNNNYSEKQKEFVELNIYNKIYDHLRYIGMDLGEIIEELKKYQNDNKLDPQTTHQQIPTKAGLAIKRTIVFYNKKIGELYLDSKADKKHHCRFVIGTQEDKIFKILLNHTTRYKTSKIKDELGDETAKQTRGKIGKMQIKIRKMSKTIKDLINGDPAGTGYEINRLKYEIKIVEE